MARTRIKICGVRHVEDALAAANAGADAIGLIFDPRVPRYIDPAEAWNIVAALPPFVTPVGVFVDVAAAAIVETAADLSLRTVQLNGHESPELVRDLEGLFVIKALRVDPGSIDQELKTWREAIKSLSLDNLAALVLEPAKTGQPGGSGVANDWNTVLQCQKSGAFDGLPPLIAAGGLTPDNVADVVRTIHPFAVDVSSGVEQSRGVKSAEKVKAFIAAVRAAER